MATNFEWDPFRDQVYTEADGGEEEIIIGKPGPNGVFFEKSGSSFTMDAKGHKLTLAPDPNAPGDEGTINWAPFEQPEKESTKIHVKNGQLILNATNRDETEVSIGESNIEILVENDARFTIESNYILGFGDGTTVFVKRNAEFVVRGSIPSSPAVISGRMLAIENAKIELHLNEYTGFENLDRTATFNLTAQDDAVASIYGQCLPVDPSAINANEKQIFTLGSGAPEIRFLRYDVEGFLPFDLIHGNYPKGIFNCLSTDASGQFRFVNWKGSAFDILRGLLEKELVAIDGVPQKNTERFRASYEPGSNDYIIRFV